MTAPAVRPRSAPAAATRQRGLALLMVLVLLVVLASALTLQSRAALRRSLAVDTQARHVQRDWALRSVAAALAPQTARLLGQAPQNGARRARGGRPPLARWSGVIRLGAVELAVRVTDEQAKVNLHALEPDAVAPALARLMGSDAAAQRVRLRPLVSAVAPRQGSDDADQGFDSRDPDGQNPDEREPDQPDTPDPQDGSAGPDAPDQDAADQAPAVELIQPGRFIGYGQVLDRPQPGELLAGGPRVELAAHWSLWGPGPLHYATATPAALRTLLGAELPEEAVESLLRARQRGRDLRTATFWAAAVAARLAASAGGGGGEAGGDGSDGPARDDPFENDFEDEFGDEFYGDFGGFSDGASDEFSDGPEDGPEDAASPDWRRWLTDEPQTRGLWLVASTPGGPHGDALTMFYVVEAGRKLQRVHQW